MHQATGWGRLKAKVESSWQPTVPIQHRPILTQLSEAGAFSVSRHSHELHHTYLRHKHEQAMVTEPVGACWRPRPDDAGLKPRIGG